jgi:hypothetical protein
MSYDLMVFEPEAAPIGYAEFFAWFAEQMQCGEDHGYGDSVEASDRLQAWHTEMLKVFPSGVGAFDESAGIDEDSYSGYSIGREMIYVIFMPVKAELARRTAVDLAAKYELGLFEPSSEQAEMWRPEAGKLVLTGEKKIWEAPEAPSFWQRILGKSRADRLPRPRLPDWM